VKPQFEAGRSHVGKGGVVRDQSVHTEVLARVGVWLEERGAAVLGMTDSGHPGPKGNVEYFVYFCDGREVAGRSYAAGGSSAADTRSATDTADRASAAVSAGTIGRGDPAEAARRAVEAAHRAAETPAGPKAAAGEGPEAAAGKGPQAAAGDAPEAPDA